MMSTGRGWDLRRARVSCFVAVILTVVAAGDGREALAEEQVLDGGPVLEYLRQMVAENEACFSLIKMDWSSRVERSISDEQYESLMARMPGSTGGTIYTHYAGTWAQDGVKQYRKSDFFSGPDNWVDASIETVDGEVRTLANYGGTPGVSSGSIGTIDDFRKDLIPMMVFGLMPDGPQHMLSDLLVPQYAFVHEKTEIIDGHKTYMVEIRRPNRPGDPFAKVWIDSERGMPLQVERYSRDPRTGEHVRTSRGTSVKLHRLPNGGWFPVSGTRVGYARGLIPYEIVTYISVDPDSITIRREDIPDSLFTIEFPESARVSNAITGEARGVSN